MSPRVDVALAQRRSGRIEHRVVRGAQGGARIAVTCRSRRGLPAPSGLQELG
jgi:hypothetical protein